MNNGNGSALMKVVHASSNLEEAYFTEAFSSWVCVHKRSN